MVTAMIKPVFLMSKIEFQSFKDFRTHPVNISVLSVKNVFSIRRNRSTKVYADPVNIFPKV